MKRGSLGLWLAVGWVGFAVLPWNAIGGQGFLAFGWLACLSAGRARGARRRAAGRRTGGCGCCRWRSRSRCRPSLFVRRLGNRAASRAADRRRHARARDDCWPSRFAIDIGGWTWPALGALFGALSGRQPGLGYGALAVAAASLMFVCHGVALRGWVERRRVRRRRHRRVGRAGRPVHALSDLAPLRPRACSTATATFRSPR